MHARVHDFMVAASALWFAAWVPAAHAQTYPAEPVRVLVGYSAGSGPDLLARAVSAELGHRLGQTFFIVNQPGANGTLAVAALVKAEANGATLLYSSASITPTPYLYKSLRYDILRDLTPIATVGVLDGNLLLVHPSLPVHDVGEFIAYAKTHRVLYGSPGIGSSLHLASELFNVKAGVAMEHLPFKGTADVNAALLGGTIQAMFVTPTSVLGLVREGQVRAVGFTGSKPFAELPAVPLVKDTVPSYPPTGSWGMFFAPARTPAAIIDTLNATIQKALAAPAVANVVGRAGYAPDGRNAAETAQFFRKEVAAAGEAVAAAKLQPN